MEKLEISKLNLTINLNNLPENIEFKDGEKSPRIEFAFFPIQVIINNLKRKYNNTEIIPLNSQKRAKNESY
jgi:hypothetical protein